MTWIFTYKKNFLGSIWPLEAMPKILASVSMILPQTMTNEALRSILLRGWSPFDDYQIAGAFAISILWIIIFLSGAILAFRYIK